MCGSSTDKNGFFLIYVCEYVRGAWVAYTTSRQVEYVVCLEDLILFLYKIVRGATEFLATIPQIKLNVSISYTSQNYSI